MDMSALIIPPEAQGAPQIVTCTVEGIVDEDDLRRIVSEAGGKAPSAEPEDNPGNLKKIREKHHSVARMIAVGGLSQRMVAQLSGYTESYLSILLNNPAMQELIEMYRIQSGAATAVITEKLKTVGLKAVEKLDERLEANELNNQELLAAAKLGLDRGGHGPQSKSHIVSEHHNIDHARLAELNAEARRRSSEFIVPVEEVRGALAPPAKDEDNGDQS